MQPSFRRCVQAVAKQASIRQYLAGGATDETVQINAWIKSVRRQKHISFVNLNDGSNLEGIQAVVPNNLLDGCGDETKNGLQTGASFTFEGKLTQKQGGHNVATSPKSNVELQVEGLRLVGSCDGATYPIQKKDHSAPFLRRNAHLRGRTSTIATVLRVRDTMTQSCYAYFHQAGYTNVAVPVITSSDCEGAGEVFTVMHGPAGKEKAFWEGKPSYLMVSGQLHLEALTVGGGLGKTWHLGPCFRAERSDTNRHLNEFWMCEAELAWINSLEDVMQVVEGLVKNLARKVHDMHGHDLEQVLPQGFEACRSITASDVAWKRLTYGQAIKELEAAAFGDPALFQHAPSYENGLRSEHERYLADRYGPTFVTDYPAKQKPFYMRANDTDDTQKPTVSCFDLLVPRVGELVGGSLREERLERLTQAMEEHGMAVENYEWYLDLRRYGSAPHGGFGLGWERLVSWLCGIENVRECIPFPRGAEASRF